MNKSELFMTYKFLIGRLTEKEKKTIESTKPHLLKANERTNGVDLKSHIPSIVNIINPQD